MSRALVPALVLAVAACGESAPATTPAVTVEPALPAAPLPPASASAIATSSAKLVEVSDAAIRTRMPELGVTIVLPPEVKPLFDDANKRYVFALSPIEQGMVELVETPAPATDQEAMALWSGDLKRDDARLLEHGGGGLEPWWSVTTFEVRMGVEGRPGMHRLQRVSRIAGLLALPAARHARCSFALEFDVEGGRSQSLDRAIGICKSLRPL